MLAIAGGKGGCGKTTTTLGLARAMSRREDRVVVVDADVDMPDLHTLAGTNPTPHAGDVADGTPPEAALQRSVECPGVEVLAAPDCGSAIVEALGRLRDRSWSVVVDTPAGGSRDVTRPLRMAETSLLVTTPTRQSLLDTAKTAALARELESTPIGSVVTRSDGSPKPYALLSCPTVGHVPAVENPLRDERVRNTYRNVVSAVSKHNA